MVIDNQATEQVNLPDDLLEEILDDAPRVSDSISDIFERVGKQRERMRRELLSANRLHRAEELPSVTSPSIAAVDGGAAIEQALGADIALVVALGIEGLVREDRRQWHGVQYVHWQQVLVRKGLNNRGFALGVMAALELKILTGAPHEVVILDGSHLTPVIGLNSMLSLDDAEFARMASVLVTKNLITENLHLALRKPEIVAMVKYDQSRDLAETWLEGFETPCDDRTTMTMLLEPGEYTIPVQLGQTPRSARNWKQLHILIASNDYPNKSETERAFKEALAYANQRQLFFTYYKPHEWSPAYRIELKRAAAEDPLYLSRILMAIREQVISPEIREPYPQYLADVMAKSVGSGIASLRAAVFHELGDRSGAQDYLRFILQSYRTEK